MSNEKVSILFVDDELDILDMYREIFELEGFKVITASSAQDAIELYKKNNDINLIISDSNMNGMSGLEFLKHPKGNYSTIPPFYLSTGAIEQSEEQIKSLGGTGLVLKPFDLDEIINRIKKDLNI